MARAQRRPQINFQVEEVMKNMYEEAKAQGHWVTRFCAAGFLLMIENPRLRLQAIQRLREWEAEFADADDGEIRAFVEGAASALGRPAPDNPPARKARAGKKKAKRPESE
ncbi:MAG: hypothetical protein AB7N71_09135 [Phycisphaerae bacterium]